LSELDSILNDAPEAAAPAAPVAGRERQSVGGGGAAVSLQAGDSFEAVYNGFTVSTAGIKPSNLYKFTLIAPATLLVVTKDKDTKVKTEERKSLEAGASISCFLGGNGNYLMNSILPGQDIELKRVADGVLPASHAFGGKPVATFEVLA
jgi:hypothetical protein